MLITLVIIASISLLPLSARRLSMMEAGRARFSLGCFWTPQRELTSDASRGRGILSAVAGYTGGSNERPTYGSVCAGDGHVEAVDIAYDSSRLTFEDLLEEFWRSSASANSVRNARGTQYAHVIWAMDAEQTRLAEASLARRRSLGDERANYVIVRPATSFYRAEGYHQDYWRKQYPRYALLAGTLAITVTPHLPPLLYQVAVAGSLTYIAIVLVEKAMNSKVEKVE